MRPIRGETLVRFVCYKVVAHCLERIELNKIELEITQVVNESFQQYIIKMEK